MSRTSILFFGDIVGDHSLKFLRDNLDELKLRYPSDFIIANGENTWEGKGINEQEANSLFNRGVDCITTGNHIWENWKSRPLLDSDPRVLRPHNYPQENPGTGYYLVEKNGQKLAVIQVQGRVFMQPIDCPFKAVDELIDKAKQETNLIFVDFHAETTAEKMAMAWHLDGRASALIGTHTHIQTGDASIFPHGLGYLTDVGMTGAYDSVLGMDKDIALKRVKLQTAHKFELAFGDVRIAGVHITLDSASGKALKVQPFMYPKFENSVIG
ncbi:MAG: TIGR00282 family metallophosphoesterase [Candidatus Kapaibacteriales bacterium]